MRPRIRYIPLLIVAAWVSASVATAQSKPVQIGLAKTFLAEQPKAFTDIATDDFKKVMKKTTGLDGDVTSKHNAPELAELLDKKQLDFALLHAHEFAALRAKHPELQPLMIAINKKHEERAFVIVKKDNPAKSIGDLRGKKLDMPTGSKEHARIYLDHVITRHAKSSTEFFGSIEKSATPKDALDNVVRGKSDATIVATTPLEFYKDVRGPVFDQNLRVLEQSEAFPPAVLVYRKGAPEAKMLEQFRTGILKAHEFDEGRDMMKEWNIDAFEAPPKDYDERLNKILKTYPPR